MKHATLGGMKAPIGWSLLALILIGASLHIPLFSGQDPAKGVVSHPRLFPYYFQSNVDAPLELSSSLGFPRYYKLVNNRVNRPVVYGFIAGAREAIVEPVLRVALGPDDGPRWGRWTPREYLATYGLWFLLNWLLIAAVAVGIFRLARAHFGPRAAAYAAVMFLSAPIVVLSAREIHLGAFHVAVAFGCIAFWHRVLLGNPSAAATAFASVGIGVLLLGKPCLDGFGAGVLICLWLGQWRKLPLIFAGAALPTVAWYLAVKAAGYPYSVGEIQFGAGIWLLEVRSFGGFLSEIRSFARDWLHCLGENVSLAHLPLAAFGAWVLRGDARGRAFLAVTLLAFVSATGFYFVVHRAHGVYVMLPLYFFYVLAGVGLKEIATRITERRPVDAAWAGYAALGMLLAIQLALNLRQLPQYGG